MNNSDIKSKARQLVDSLIGDGGEAPQELRQAVPSAAFTKQEITAKDMALHRAAKVEQSAENQLAIARGDSIWAKLGLARNPKLTGQAKAALLRDSTYAKIAAHIRN